MEYPTSVGNIIDRLEQAGEEAYIVGGSLRDSLLGLTPHDFDIATSALPQKTKSLFSDFPVIETGIRHGTVTVIVDHLPIEITTFRIDGSYADSRHPDSVRFTSRLNDDLSRRDFTVNAMAYHPKRGLVDPFGGRQDLEKKIIRAVGTPELRFQEDALRIMRAFRFSAQLGFTIAPETLLGAYQTRDGLSRIARERICSEFLRLLTAPDPAPALVSMKEHGIFPYIADVFSPNDNILPLLCQMPAKEEARLGLLFAGESEETIRTILHSLKCSTKQITVTVATARGAGFAVTSPHDAARLIALTGCYAPLAVRASVLLGNSLPQAEEWVAQNRCPTSLSDLAISGRDLSDLGITGKDIGDTLRDLLDVVMREPQKNQKEWLLQLACKHKAAEKPFPKEDKKHDRS